MIASSTTAAAATSSPLLVERYRCPEDLGGFSVGGELSGTSGFFRFGSATCYGRRSFGKPAGTVTDLLEDVLGRTDVSGANVSLAFDPAQVIENLCRERYTTASAAGESGALKKLVRNAYYLVRPLMPVSVRKHFQKMYLSGWDKVPFPQWPVDRTVENLHERLMLLSMKARGVDRVPFIWFWPEGAPSCTILTHDVETSSGVDFCPQLMDLNDAFGIKSAFQVVPEVRYPVPESFLESIRSRGFEVNVHDLNHDGHLFGERQEFMRRAAKINSYGRQFAAQGFRSAVLYRNADWFGALDFAYDMSIPNVAHLDPQRGGCCTVMPFFIGNIIELPVTLTQDYSLFNILNDYSIRLWKQQVGLIREKHGLISLIVHPDYIIAEAARKVYAEMLQYLSEMRLQGETWIALPRDVAAWWRSRNQMSLVKSGDSWRIEGPDSARARLAFAVRDGEALRYEVASA